MNSVNIFLLEMVNKQIVHHITENEDTIEELMNYFNGLVKYENKTVSKTIENE